MGMLDKKVAIVTGGGRGLGRAHCLALAAAGATVVVNDIGAGLHGEPGQESPAHDVVGEIVAAGGAATTDGTSVADWAGTEALVRATVAEFGRLDIVVNNAGIVRDRMLFSMTEQDFDAVVSVHLKGTFAMTRHACAHWREASKRGEPVSGRIVNTTSGTGLFGTVGQANYGAAKAGIVALTTITALEMAPLRRHGERHLAARHDPDDPGRRVRAGGRRHRRSSIPATRPTSPASSPTWPRTRPRGSPARCSASTATACSG